MTSAVQQQTVYKYSFRARKKPNPTAMLPSTCRLST